MSSASGAVKAGRAYVEIFADADRMRDSLKSVMGDLRHFKQAAETMQSAAAAPLKAAMTGAHTDLKSVAARLHRVSAAAETEAAKKAAQDRFKHIATQERKAVALRQRAAQQQSAADKQAKSDAKDRTKEILAAARASVRRATLQQRLQDAMAKKAARDGGYMDSAVAQFRGGGFMGAAVEEFRKAERAKIQAAQDRFKEIAKRERIAAGRRGLADEKSRAAQKALQDELNYNYRIDNARQRLRDKAAAQQRRIDAQILASRRKLNAELKRNYEQDARNAARAAQAKLRAEQRAARERRQEWQNSRWSLAVVGGAAGIGARGMVGGLGGAQGESLRAEKAEFGFALQLGKEAGKMREWAQQLRDSLHLNMADVQNSMQGTHGVMRGFGMSQDEAAARTKTLTKNIVDFAAKSGLSYEETTQRFVSMLEGESEALDRFGINTKVERITEKLAQMGLDETEINKVRARMAILDEAFGQLNIHGAREQYMETFAGRLEAATNEWIEFKREFGDQLKNILAPFVGDLAKTIEGLRLFVKENPGVVKLAVGFTALLAAVAAASIGIYVLTHAWGLLKVGGGVGWGLLKGIGATLLWLATSPIGAVAAGIAIGVAAFATFTDSGRRMMREVSVVWGQIKANVSTAVGAIWNAIRQGDLAAAWDVVMAGWAYAWEAGLHQLRTVWIGFRTAIKTLLLETVGTILGSWGRLKYGLLNAWYATEDALMSAIEGTTRGMAGLWASATARLAAGLLVVSGQFQGLTEAQIDEQLATLAEDHQRRMDRIGEAIDKSLGKPFGRKRKRNTESLDEWWRDAAKAVREYAAAIKNAESASGDEMAAAADRVAEAKKAFDAAVAKANDTRAGVGVPGAGTGIARDGSDTIKPLTGHIFGTFNPFAAGRQFGPRSVDKIEKNTKKTADEGAQQVALLRRIDTNLTNNLAFA